MKKLFVAMVLIANLGNAQSLDNRKVVEQLFLEGWNERTIEGIRDRIADTVTFHLNNYHFTTNAQELEQLINTWHNAFDDFQFEIISLVSEGDMVAINLRYTGKHVKEFMGVAPRNNEVSVSEMMFFRFEEDKMVEAWEVYDEKGMLAQMKGSR